MLSRAQLNVAGATSQVISRTLATFSVKKNWLKVLMPKAELPDTRPQSSPWCTVTVKGQTHLPRSCNSRKLAHLRWHSCHYVCLSLYHTAFGGSWGSKAGVTFLVTEIGSEFKVTDAAEAAVCRLATVNKHSRQRLRRFAGTLAWIMGLIWIRW